MPIVKAANMRRELRRMSSFGAQIGMALHTELVVYGGQGLMIASALSVAGDTLRGERLLHLMHQTGVTRGAHAR